MRITIPPPGESAVTDGVSWTDFLAILDELGETRGSRVAYDQGRLEIVSPSKLHERVGSLLGRFVEILTLELGMDIESIKATTLLREDLQKGAESDECFYIANEPLVRPYDDVDPSRNPPPDLVIEIDVSRECVNRLAIYAAMGVPEAWRYHDGELDVLVLKDGEYVEVEVSPTFPDHPIAEFLRLVERRHELSDTELARRFQAWVRERTGSSGA